VSSSFLDDGVAWKLETYAKSNTPIINKASDNSQTQKAFKLTIYGINQN